MFKYFIYLLKRNLNLIILEFGVLLTILYLNTISNFTSYIFSNIILSILLFMLPFITIITMGNILEKDLYSYEGYFIYTLPINSFNIVISKIALCLIYIYSNLIIINTYFIFKDSVISKVEFNGLFKIFPHLLVLITVVYFLIVIYKILIDKRILNNILVAISIIVFADIYQRLLQFINNVIIVILCILSVVLMYIISKLLENKVNI